MRTLNEYAGLELQWVQPNRRRPDYELRSRDEVLAHLYRKGASALRVQMETADGNWLIERRGLLQTITILSLDEDTKAGAPSIKRGISGKATLRFPDGQAYRWQCASFWRGEWTWLDGEGVPLLRVKKGTDVLIEQAARDMPLQPLALLVALGWFLYRLQAEEAASASVSAIVPVIGS